MHSKPVKFSGQELEKSLDKIQGILHTAKSLAIQLVPYENVKGAITNYIEAVQAFLSQEEDAAKNYQEEKENKGKQRHSNNLERQKRIDELKNKLNNGETLIPKEQEELTKLMRQQGELSSDALESQSTHISAEEENLLS